jgi:hypothetical protein
MVGSQIPNHYSPPIPPICQYVSRGMDGRKCVREVRRVVVVRHAGIEGARRHAVAVVAGRTGKDVSERGVCGVCGICLHEEERIGMSLRLGGGMREWKKTAGGSGYRDKGVNICREERRHTAYRIFSLQHDLDFRESLGPF